MFPEIHTNYLIEDFKEAVNQKIKLHNEIHSNLSSTEREELKQMFNPKKIISKKKRICKR